jgi:hypothetical protein
MTQLIVQEVIALAYTAGWRGNDVVTATAVARAESGYRTDAEGPKLCGKGGARGLWQINICVHNCPNYNDANANAACAHKIFQSQGWKAWEAYTNGRYKAFLSSATKAYANIQSDAKKEGKTLDQKMSEISGKAGVPGDIVADAAGAASTIIPGVKEIGEFFNALTQGNTWIRVGEGALGLLLLVVGVAAITRGTPIGSAIRTGAKAMPAGKAIGKVIK